MFKQEKNNQNPLEDRIAKEMWAYLRENDVYTLNRIYQEVRMLKVLFTVLDFMLYILVPVIFFTTEFLIAWKQSKSILIATLAGCVFFTIIKLLTIVTRAIVKLIRKNSFSY